MAKAQELIGLSANKEVSDRTRVIKRHFNIGGTSLKDFIYETFPEIVSLRLGEEIRHEY